MPGILDQIDQQISPQQQGLLAAGFQGLQSSGFSRTPMSLGQIIGQAGQAGMGQMNNAFGQQTRLALAKEQIDAMKEQRTEQARLLQEQVAEKQRRTKIIGDIQAEISKGGDQDEINARVSRHIFALDPIKGMEMQNQVKLRMSEIEQRAEAARQRSEDARLSREEREAARRESAADKERFLRLAASMRPEPAPALTTIADPADPTKGQVIDARTGRVIGGAPPARPADSLAGQRHVDNTTIKFADDLQKNKVPQAGASISQLNETLGKYNSETLPGVGYVKNFGGASFFLSEEGKKVKSQAQAVANDLLAMYSGLAVTLPEAERRQIEQMSSGQFSANDFYNAWPTVVNRYNTIIGNIVAGYPQEAVSTYKSRPGAMNLEPLKPPAGKPVAGDTSVVREWSDNKYQYRQLKNGDIQRKAK